MEKIIDPVDIDLLLAELTEERRLCATNKAGNVLYVFDGREAPNLLREVGRLREISFRAEGGCSGKSCDLDEYDTMDKPYQQMIVWDPDAKAILGGYRFILGPDIKIGENGQPELATSHLFSFSQRFIRDYLPHTMELGRSFVTPDYQSSKAGAKALFALDNLWDGIAAITMNHPGIFYLFGKMTIYNTLPAGARDLILRFLDKHFPDSDELVRPISPVLPVNDPHLLDLILKDGDFKDDYRNLKAAVRSFDTNIPPLVNSYMNTSPSMRVFGTAECYDLSDAMETAILVPFNEMYEDKRDRHIQAFFRDRLARVRARFPHLDLDNENKLVRRFSEIRDRTFRRFKEKREKKEK
jgi:hypothetical protein